MANIPGGKNETQPDSRKLAGRTLLDLWQLVGRYAGSFTALAGTCIASLRSAHERRILRRILKKETIVGAKNETQPNFRKLAEQYASFFTALAGICITVLTLSLALNRQPVNPDLYSALIASLFVATAVSFIGAHLMAETAASMRLQATSPGTSSEDANAAGSIDVTSWLVGGRLFLIASINIYIAAILTSFSLMLLPAAYERLPPRGLICITITGFLAVVLSAYYWMIRYFVSRIRPLEMDQTLKPSGKQSAMIKGASGAASLLIVFLHGEIVQTAEFIILILLSASSGFYFNQVYHQDQRGAPPDWKPVSLFFYAAITFSCMTILALGLRLIVPVLFSSRTPQALPP